MQEYQPDPIVRQFFEWQVVPIIKNLFSESYKIPDIGKKLSENWEKIAERYGCNVSIEASDSFPSDDPGEGKMLMFGCALKDGKPKMVMFVRNLIMIWSTIGGNSSVWESFVVVGVMHELDHLALGVVELTPTRDIPKIIEGESIVWARTCQNTMRLLVENNWPLCGSDQDLYNAWISCNRKEKSSQWISFIKKRYGQLVIKS